MPQRDDPPTPSSFAEATDDKWLRRTRKIEAIKRLEPPSRVRYGGPGALLEYAVMHNREERWNGGKVERWDTTPSLNHTLPRLNPLKRGQWGHLPAAKAIKVILMFIPARSVGGWLHG